MITLTLPPETQSPIDWQAFRIALDFLELDLIETPDGSTNSIKVKINAESQEQQQAVLDLVLLCFSKHYVV